MKAINIKAVISKRKQIFFAVPKKRISKKLCMNIMKNKKVRVRFE